MLLESYELFVFMHISNFRNFQIKFFWFVLIFQIYKTHWEINSIKIEESILYKKDQNLNNRKKLNENFKKIFDM